AAQSTLKKSGAIGENMSELLKTDGLAIGYSSASGVLCRNLNLSLNAGEMVCLLGPNGSGKSTLLRTLAGLQPPIDGIVWLGRQNIIELARADLAQQLAVVLTEKPAAGMLRVYDLVALGRIPYSNLFGRLSEEDHKVVRQSLKQVHLLDYQDRLLTELSDGEAQRVMIARALAQESEVIILDEPTVHLDLPTRIEVLSLLHRLSRDTGKAILLSTHELNLALQLADSVWLLDDDHQLQIGMPEELVLSGALKAAFARPGFELDLLTGTLQLPENVNGKSVMVLGEDETAEWTRRAIQRSGFLLAEESRGGVASITPNEKGWMLQTNHQEIHISTLKALLDTLKQL
ncbi:MAG: ABC transporter ATP-binding protein, partial [Calditrichota bacterium]